MISFPNAKINLGLYITSKRGDGYHNIETIFYPAPIYDMLELVRRSTAQQDDCIIHLYGLPVHGNTADNLCVKAYHLLKKDFPLLPPVDVHLYKNIPMGAGLGGGSADGACMLSLLNEKFLLNIDEETLCRYALQLGSDCPFFIINKPCIAKGRGEIMEPIALNLQGYYLMLVNPSIHISTAQAFSSIQPAMPEKNIHDIISMPISAWKDILINDFEKSVFTLHPQIAGIKQQLYNAGAVYASMTGTGSTVYGLFEKKIDKPETLFPDSYFVKMILL